MKKILFLLIIFLSILIFKFNNFKNNDKEQISIIVPTEMKGFIKFLNSKYLKDKKNLEILVYYIDDDFDIFEDKYLTNDKKSYLEWKTKYNKIDNKKEEINKKDFLLFLNSQNYKFKQRYGKFDINIFTSSNLEKFFKEYDYNILDFLQDDLVIIGRKKFENLSDITNSNITIVNPKYEVGNSSYNFILNNDNYNQLLKNTKYTNSIMDNIISVDLYESEYAIVSRLSSKMTKNSFICYNIYNDKSFKINYRIAIKNNDNINANNYFKFLSDHNNIYNYYQKYIAK